jgi:hypothetical protein
VRTGSALFNLFFCLLLLSPDSFALFPSLGARIRREGEKDQKHNHSFKMLQVRREKSASNDNDCTEVEELSCAVSCVLYSAFTLLIFYNQTHGKRRERESFRGSSTSTEIR